jgi:hypothetical protein
MCAFVSQLLLRSCSSYSSGILFAEFIWLSNKKQHFLPVIQILAFVTVSWTVLVRTRTALSDVIYANVILYGVQVWARHMARQRALRAARNSCGGSPGLAEDVCIRFHFWIAIKATQFCPRCEIRERSLCVLRYRFIGKVYCIFVQEIHFLKSDAF